jgi:hypothetical protein
VSSHPGVGPVHNRAALRILKAWQHDNMATCSTHIVEFQLRLRLVLLVVAGQLVQNGSAASASIVRGGRLGIQVAVGVWNTSTPISGASGAQ